MTPSIPRICIAMGDPAGISPELLAKLLARGDLMQLACVAVVGDRRVLAEGETVAGAKSNIAVVALAEIEAATPGNPVFVDLRHLDPATIPRGEASAAGGGFAMRNFREALLLAKSGRADGVLFTPPVGASVLPGITRSTVITLCEEMKIPVREQMIPREMLYIADEIFFTGTAAEISPLRSIDRIQVGKGSRGPITKALQEEFFSILSGAKADRHNWLTPVSVPLGAGTR